MYSKNYRQSYKDFNNIKLYKDYKVLVLLLSFMSTSQGYGGEAQTQPKPKNKKTLEYTGN